MRLKEFLFLYSYVDDEFLSSKASNNHARFIWQTKI